MKSFYSGDDIIIHLKKLIKKIELFQKALQSEELANHQARIIYPLIKYKQGYSIKELSLIGDVDKGYVSRTIADLENKGIIERKKQKNYSVKNYKIILTAKGEQLMEERIASAEKTWQELFNNVPREKVKKFCNLLLYLTK